MKQAVDLARVRDLGVFQQVKKLFEPANVLATLTKLVDVWEVELAIERHMPSSVDRQTPLLENVVVLVFDVVVVIHKLIVVQVA